MHRSRISDFAVIDGPHSDTVEFLITQDRKPLLSLSCFCPKLVNPLLPFPLVAGPFLAV